MRLDNMVEVVRSNFPKVPRVQIVFDLNMELIAFARRTGVLYERDVLTYDTDLLSEDEDANQSVWQLPANLFELTRVEQISQHDWRVNEDELTVRWIDSDIDRLDIEYSRYPAALVLDSDEPELPDEFHYAIVYKLLSRYSVEYTKDSGSAMYFHNAYKELEKEAKRYMFTRNKRNGGASGATSGGSLIKTTWKTGVHLYEGLNTVTMDITFTGVDTYALLMNGNGIEVTEYDPNLNHDQRTTSSYKVIAAAETTRFDYLATGT